MTNKKEQEVFAFVRYCENCGIKEDIYRRINEFGYCPACSRDLGIYDIESGNDED